MAAQNPHNNNHHYHCDVDGTNNSDVNACPPLSAASKPLSPIISYDMTDHEVILELETKVETYEGLPAPCVDDCCLLHPVISDITCNAISTDIKLLSSKFETPRSRRLLLQLDPTVKIEPRLGYSKEESSTSGSSLVSESGSFFCPVQGCLTTISNTTIPTSMEFIATVAHHISTHDLSEGDTERVLMIYLAEPWKRPVRPKAWDVTATQLNMKTLMLNIHAYWILNAKKTHDQREPSHVSTISTTTLTRSARKRVTSRARIHIIPSSSPTTSPRSITAIRQMRVASTSSVTQFSDPLEAIPSATPFQHPAIVTTAESTRTSLAQETIATSTLFVRRTPRRERYRRNERDSSSSPVRQGRLRRPAPSNNSNHNGNESVGPVRKRQRDGRPLRIDVSEDDDGAGTGMRTGSAHGSRRGRFQSRGRATVRKNEMQSTWWSSRSRSKAKTDINATGTALRRSARSRSKPRPFRSARMKLSGPCKIETPKDPFHCRPRMDDYVQVLLEGSEDDEEDGMIDYFLYSAEARKKMARQQIQAAESSSSSTSPPNTRVVADSILPDKAIF